MVKFMFRLSYPELEIINDEELAEIESEGEPVAFVLHLDASSMASKPNEHDAGSV